MKQGGRLDEREVVVYGGVGGKSRTDGRVMTSYHWSWGEDPLKKGGRVVSKWTGGSRMRVNDSMGTEKSECDKPKMMG